MDSASPPGPENGTFKVPQKRPRPVLSCLECRGKKLKCSRTLPCVQCTKTGRASRCSYNEYPLSTASSEAGPDVSYLGEGGRARKIIHGDKAEQHKENATPSSGSKTALTSVAKLGIIEDLQSRVEKLEHQLINHALNIHHAGDQKPDEDYQAKRYNVNSRAGVRLKDSTTRYHGQNRKVALLNHVGLFEMELSIKC